MKIFGYFWAQLNSHPLKIGVEGCPDLLKDPELSKNSVSED